MLSVLIRKIAKYFNTFAVRQTTFLTRNFFKTTSLGYNLYAIKNHPFNMYSSARHSHVIPLPKVLEQEDYKIKVSRGYVAQF